jgi:16S rRNA (guanine966-N2)-methyltransferase
MTSVAQHLRVIAGSAGGRRLFAPRGDTIRPTTGRVKEAVFSALTAREHLLGAHVLDLYAGTGALAIESISRNAARAVLVEREPGAIDALRRNLSVTGTAAAASIVTTDVAAFLGAPPPADAPFDLVFCDPPYDLSGEALDALLAPLARRDWTNEDALVVLERPAGSDEPRIKGLRIDWERRFGDTLMFFLSA